MEYTKSNFIYLKKTSMEKYYDELMKAEYVCMNFPIVTKVIVRKIIEAFLNDIAEKYNIENNVPAWNLLNNIKLSSNLFLPVEICNYIEIILINGYDHASINSRKKIISKGPIEILEIMNNILFWYIKKTESQTMMLVEDLDFRAPSTIPYMEKELIKINQEIIIKDTQINNLRQKIIGLGSETKNISNINNIIISIKEDRSCLQKKQILLNKKIQMQKKQVLDTEKKYKMYVKKLDDLKEKCNESQELLFEKESNFVAAEIQKQELKNLIENLDEQDESIKKIEYYLEEELKILRKAYEHLLSLTNQYQDILETIEFSYNKNLQKILEIQKKNIEIKINFDDEIFNENIINYTKNTVEAKRKIIIFKEILDEKIKKEIKYEIFYKGFLKLEGRELRILYTIINNSIVKSNLVDRSKELLSRVNGEKFLESLNKNLEELKNVNDDEIKLILYYKLEKLSQVYLGNICSRKQFVQSLDDMVDKAYEILINKSDFKGREKKLDAIISYYFEKIIFALKRKSNNLQINEELINKICRTVMELKQKPENIDKVKIYYEKFNLYNISEETLKAAIKLQPFVFLSIMANLGDITSYKEMTYIILEAYSLIEQKPLFKVDGENSFGEGLLSEYLMILLFLSSKTISLNQKQEELLPLLVVEIISTNLISNDDVIKLESYNRMIDLWKHKQQKYNDIFIEKEDKENTLELLIREKKELEENHEKLLRSHGKLLASYNNYKEEFKNIIMNSEKRILLPSYMDYDELRSKKETAEKNINESKNKFGTLKSIFSPEVWKEQAIKLINESNMLEAEKLLIEEAKQKPYFKKEYLVFLDLEERIEKTNELILRSNESIKNKSLLIDNIKVTINELQKQLNNIKDIYFDMEEGYY